MILRKEMIGLSRVRSETSRRLPCDAHAKFQAGLVD